MPFKCLFYGHKWRSFTVGYMKRVGLDSYVPQVWLNDRCVRCHEYRNPLIAAEQEFVMRVEPYYTITGEYKKGDETHDSLFRK